MWGCKAAELHGATHHAVMDFQVVTDRQLPKIRAGRSWLTFHFRKELTSIREGIVEHKTDYRHDEGFVARADGA